MCVFRFIVSFWFTMYFGCWNLNVGYDLLCNLGSLNLYVCYNLLYVLFPSWNLYVHIMINCVVWVLESLHVL